MSFIFFLLLIVDALCGKLFFIGCVVSNSMTPTIPMTSLIVVKRGAGENDNLLPGRIVIFHHGNRICIKRIIGVENDEILIQNGQVYRNNSEIAGFPYTGTKSHKPESYIVPADCLFVLGDNRAESADSRLWTQPFISVSDVIATVK